VPRVRRERLARLRARRGARAEPARRVGINARWLRDSSHRAVPERRPPRRAPRHASATSPEGVSEACHVPVRSAQTRRCQRRKVQLPPLKSFGPVSNFVPFHRSPRSKSKVHRSNASMNPNPGNSCDACSFLSEVGNRGRASPQKSARHEGSERRLKLLDAPRTSCRPLTWVARRRRRMT
jgi:hypothetical protein